MVSGCHSINWTSAACRSSLLSLNAAMALQIELKISYRILPYLSNFTLFYLILLYFTLFYFILLYFTSVYLILLYFTLFYFILLYFTLFYFIYLKEYYWICRVYSPRHVKWNVLGTFLGFHHLFYLFSVQDAIPFRSPSCKVMMTLEVQILGCLPKPHVR